MEVSGLITVLMLVVFISPAETTTTIITLSPTPAAVPNTTGTTAPQTSQKVAATSTIGEGGANTTVVGGRATTTAIGGAATTAITSHSSSSVVLNKTEGPKVILALTVTIDCNITIIRTITINLQLDIKEAFVRAGISIKIVKVIKITCEISLKATLELCFYSGIPSGKTIKGVFEDAVKNRSIRNLTTNNTEATFTFKGVNIVNKPKAGQCQQVCCDGAGGEMTVVPKCTPTNKCEGIELTEKKEDGHCPGDSIGDCTTCEKDDSESIHTMPNFSVVILLALALFVKTMVY